MGNINSNGIKHQMSVKDIPENKSKEKLKIIQVEGGKKILSKCRKQKGREERSKNKKSLI